MPRLYVTPSELLELPLGLAVANMVSNLNADVLDKMLARASQRADTFCKKRLQAPSSSTLSQSCSANAFSVNVASTLTLDDKAEQAVILDFGNSNQETLEIAAGGVSVTNWLSPYPGTLTLYTPTQFAHTSGAPVKYVYKEVTLAKNSSVSDPYSEALMSQAAQLALAHLPPIHIGLTRIVFTNTYPIQNVFTVEHAYSFDTTYNVIYNSADTTFNGQIIIDSVPGFYRFRVGTVVIPQGNVRTTYIGGYSVIPDDIKLATMYYLSDQFMQLSNPYLATEMQQGKRKQQFKMEKGKTPAAMAAEEILGDYKRRV